MLQDIVVGIAAIHFFCMIVVNLLTTGLAQNVVKN